MGGCLLQVRDLRQGFQTFKGIAQVLNGVELVVHEREKVGLIGESGCGKTTTMKCITRILPMPPGIIFGGEICFKGKNILRTDSKKTYGVKGISMIFQDPTAALNPVFTIGQQLADVVKYSGGGGERKLSKREIKNRTVSVLRDVAMPDPERILKNYPFQLSGGMRQRVCIAKALIGVRDLLIADEPGTSLDVTIRDQILRLLDNLVGQRGISIILISHAIGAVKSITDRVYVMYAGNMVEVAPTQELFRNPLHPYTRALFAAIPRLTGEGIGKGIDGRPPDYLDPPPGCRFHPRCPYSMPICKKERPFLRNVGHGHGVACFLYGE